MPIKFRFVNQYHRGSMFTSQSSVLVGSAAPISTKCWFNCHKKNTINSTQKNKSVCLHNRTVLNTNTRTSIKILFSLLLLSKGFILLFPILHTFHLRPISLYSHSFTTNWRKSSISRRIPIFHKTFSQMKARPHILRIRYVCTLNVPCEYVHWAWKTVDEGRYVYV